MEMDEHKSGSPQEESPPRQEKKPVLIYIFILFIAAFLLMALSFFMHQRSNQQVLGELSSQVNSVQALQEALEKNLQLQQELEDSQSQQEAQQEALQEELDAQELESEAMIGLYRLQQAFSNRDYELCQSIISEMEQSGLVAHLPDTVSSQETVTAPQIRFQQFKDAVAAAAAEAE